jgi:taurine--2-oxoglutarate transaminase
VPLGGVLVSKEIAEYFDDNPLMCGLTYSGHPIGCAAGLATLEVYKEEKLIENSKLMGKVLGEELEALKIKHKSVGDVRYIGLFSSIELIKNTVTNEALVPYGKDPEGIMGKILGMLKEKGFSTYTHENIIIVAPPLIIKEEEIKEAMSIMDEVLDYVDSLVEN